jgi:hypothetical protein
MIDLALNILALCVILFIGIPLGIMVLAALGLILMGVISFFKNIYYNHSFTFYFLMFSLGILASLIHPYLFWIFFIPGLLRVFFHAKETSSIS